MLKFINPVYLEIGMGLFLISNLTFLFKKPIKTIDGGDLMLSADRICIHSDTPSAILFAESIHKIVDILY